MNDYYAVLGIEKNATKAEIKAAYRFLAAQLHPDKHQGQGVKIAEKKLKEINEAYEILIDDAERAKYDNHYNMNSQNQTWTYQRADINAEAERKARARRERETKEQFYNQQELYNDYAFDQEIDQEILHKSNARQSESKNPFMTLLKIIIACVIFGIIIKSCPTQKEPNRTPPPRVKYTLPASEGSSITVKSDILTRYF